MRGPTITFPLFKEKNEDEIEQDDIIEILDNFINILDEFIFHGYNES